MNSMTSKWLTGKEGLKNQSQAAKSGECTLIHVHVHMRLLYTVHVYIVTIIGCTVESQSVCVCVCVCRQHRRGECPD